MDCSVCHSGYPKLNAYGQMFKANGFRLPGGEKSPPTAWKTIPISLQVQPVYQRFNPSHAINQYTDTSVLVGGLLSPTTSFYLHHDLYFDETPVPFPSYEFWIQQVLDERNKTMLKIGQFELPISYSPQTNRTTYSVPTLLTGSIDPNDVTLSGPMNGFQLSTGKLTGTQLQLAIGAPSFLSGGNLNGKQNFLSKYRDIFFRIAQGPPSAQAGIFTYLIDPPRDPSNPATSERGQRYGFDSRLILGSTDIQLLALYGENADPTGSGRSGFLRGGSLEVDHMFGRIIGLTGRWDLQTEYIDGAKQYSEARTFAIRGYIARRIRLLAEYQWLAHGQSDTTLMATVAF
jgi:hypothetical protein